jgi:hypothetical protein
MITRFCQLALVIGLASVSSVASAQSPQDQQHAVAVVAAVGQHASTDTARIDGGTLLYVGGWAFECSSGTQAITDLLIDGNVAAGVTLYSAAREDVRVWATTYGVCDFAHTPYYSGLNAWVDLASLHLAPGAHAAQIRIRNVNGVATPGNPVTFTVQ